MAQPVDLCIIAEHFHPILSGASERFRRYLPGLRERGIEARVFTIWHEGLQHEERIEETLIQRFELPPSNLHPSAELTRQTLLYCKRTGQWPHIVHVLSHTLQGVPYLWQIRLHGLPCINSITMDPYRDVTSVPEKIKFQMHQRLRYGVFNQLIVSSEVISRSAQQSGISAGRIKVIPNGVDIKRFSPLEDLQEKKRLRKKLGFSADENIVLFVGFLSYRKGVDLLLEAWPRVVASHPQATLVLIGSEDRRGELAATFVEHRVGELSNVCHLNPVENIEEYMQIADILVLPSRVEGMPNVVLEGMACALPCIVTPFQSLPETFGQPGVDYVLTTYQPEHIAADINSLLSDACRRRKIGQAAMQRARAVHDVEFSLDKHAEIYHRFGSHKRASIYSLFESRHSL